MWQRVLHGGSEVVRAEVAKVLLDAKGEKGAYRYACCGLADQVSRRGDEVFVSPRGCGHKLCPRCGRRRGGRYARRIMGWLAQKEHGDLWSVVLTQQVVAGEDLAAARSRMAGRQRRYMRWLDGVGLIGAMTCAHVVWSGRAGGWHYHVHVMVELPVGVMNKERLLQKWVDLAEGGKCHTDEHQARLIVSAGGPILELAEDSGDTDFWHESKGPVARAVQYPLRDLVQGVSAWRLGGDEVQLRRCAFELVTQACGWKMFRAWGRWRKACPAAEKEAEGAADAEDVSAGAPGPAVGLGTVGRLWRAARSGDQAARAVFRGLEKSVRNESSFAARLVRYCRLAGADSGG
jgi:hypothetical protein